ncbi:chorion peroxidase-like [Penaeus monodon]|uniref:chorion peroxidase-like n=1 Tax=Penaeus monodon TaxID=6687 RepID=UPI0018A79A9F|nr:chorion peroxidase-like [Penaeus monodon]
MIFRIIEFPIFFPTGGDGKALPCCPDILGDDPSLMHPECAPIAIPANDPFYASFNQTCMEFARSVADSRCELGPRMQINEKTSYLDGSVIYGTDKAQSDSLRMFEGGMLNYQISESEELLPANPSMAEECNKEGMASEGRFCFKSGDMRVNVQPLLTALHILWSRRHNHIAKDLADLNPSWEDERIFQEARRIVAAELQHVIYAEYVSSVLGPIFTKQFNLRPLKGEKRTSLYNEGINAAISAPFSGAAFRFGHSQIPGSIQEMDANGDASSQSMSSAFMNPFALYSKGTLANLLRGELAQSATRVDSFFSPQVAGRLFRGGMPFGLDLVALNVQRGRDHGLPPYTAMRAVCNLPLVTSFAELLPDIEGRVAEQLERLYSHVDDVDLFIGGLAEKPVPGGLVGPTFACILADQFLRLKVGDRYWYETSDPETRFETAQLMEIRNSSLGRILCDVIPELKEVQMNPLRKMSEMNPLMPCSSFKRVSFHPWKEV